MLKNKVLTPLFPGLYENDTFRVLSDIKSEAEKSLTITRSGSLNEISRLFSLTTSCNLASNGPSTSTTRSNLYILEKREVKLFFLIKKRIIVFLILAIN